MRAHEYLEAPFNFGIEPNAAQKGFQIIGAWHSLVVILCQTDEVMHCLRQQPIVKAGDDTASAPGTHGSSIRSLARLAAMWRKHDDFQRFIVVNSETASKQIILNIATPRVQGIGPSTNFDDFNGFSRVFRKPFIKRFGE